MVGKSTGLKHRSNQLTVAEIEVGIRDTDVQAEV